MRRPSLRRAWLALLGGLVMAPVAAGWAAFAPLPSLPRERLVVIPPGTTGQSSLFPAKIRLTLGIQDVLVVRNDDLRVQRIGDVILRPGQSFSIPFRRADDFEFTCSAHPSGKTTISVSANPEPGVARLRWRLASLRGDGA